MWQCAEIKIHAWQLKVLFLENVIDVGGSLSALARKVFDPRQDYAANALPCPEKPR